MLLDMHATYFISMLISIPYDLNLQRRSCTHGERVHRLMWCFLSQQAKYMLKAAECESW